MDNDMNHTRLNAAALEAAVDFAYGGAAVREGRKAQARTIAAIFRVKPTTDKKAGRLSTTKV